MSSDVFIVGDIGGTKAHLATFSRQDGPRKMLTDVKFPSKQYDSLEDIIEIFLKQAKLQAASAVFAVAGPVIGGKAKITNLPWLVDRDTIQQKFGFSQVFLINDLAAIAASVPILHNADVHILNKGKPCKNGVIAVIAPGTGLGIAHLSWDGGKYIPHPSEGGHAGFAPADRLQSGLLRFLHPILGRVSCENVCSGRGIPNIYEYLKAINFASDSKRLALRIAKAQDPAPIITQATLSNKEGADLCVATMNTFVSILGTVSGNAALTFLATGGVYLAGGIPKIILPLLEEPAFIKSFMGDGPMSNLLSQIPVKVIIHPNPALLGAAYILMSC